MNRLWRESAPLNYVHIWQYLVHCAKVLHLTPDLTVKTLTKLFSPTPKPKPNCLAAWQEKISDLSPSPPIGLLYSDTLLGPFDYYNHFKFITHCALARIIAMDKTTPCLLCSLPRSNTTHYTKCRTVDFLWTRAASLFDTPPLTAPQILLGRDLELGACHFLTILWKFIIGCIFAGDTQTYDLE